MSMGLKLKVDSKTGEVLRPRPTVVCGPSRTKQSFRDQVNINKIIERAQKTGMVSHLNKNQPFYGDVSELVQYQEALDVVHKANDLFMEMSSKIRNKFDNDPMKMIEFLSDEKNRAEAVSLGMVMPKPEEKIPEVNLTEKALNLLKGQFKGSKGTKGTQDED